MSANCNIHREASGSLFGALYYRQNIHIHVLFFSTQIKLIHKFEQERKEREASVYRVCIVKFWAEFFPSFSFSVCPCLP